MLVAAPFAPSTAVWAGGRDKYKIKHEQDGCKYEYKADQNCVGQALEQGNAGQSIAWSNPSTGGRYQVTPGSAATDPQGRYCREYTTNANVGGQAQLVFGKACRQPDGSWRIVR